MTTGLTGTFSFPISTPGATASVSVMPTKGGCTFNPSVVNLNGITGSRTVNFTGTGASCVGVARPTAVDPGTARWSAGRGGAAATPQPTTRTIRRRKPRQGWPASRRRSDTTPAPGLTPA